MRFNGIDPRTISPRVSVCKEIVSSIPPRELSLIESAAGWGFAGLTLQPRTFRVQINIASFTRPGGWELAQRIADWICTDEPCELEPTHTPGRAFTAILASASDLELVRGFGTVEYVFTIPRPFYHSVDERVEVLPGGGRIHVRGNVPARLLVTHTMAQAADALTVSHDGTPFMRLRRRDGEQIPTGVTLCVDMERKLVTLSGEPAPDLIDYTACDWHEPIHGSTQITVNDAGRTQIRWRDEWM